MLAVMKALGWLIAVVVLTAVALPSAANAHGRGHHPDTAQHHVKAQPAMDQHAGQSTGCATTGVAPADAHARGSVVVVAAPATPAEHQPGRDCNGACCFGGSCAGCFSALTPGLAAIVPPLRHGAVVAFDTSARASIAPGGLRRPPKTFA